MARIGLFGGSFNPVHIAHMILAQCAHEQAGLDSVLFMPARRPPHKSAEGLADDADRVAMLSLAIGDNAAFDVSELELRREGPSYTLTTVRELKAGLRADDELCMLIGSDSLRDLPTWWRATELVREVEILTFLRRNAPLRDPEALEQTFGPQTARELRANVVRAPLLEISATQVRERRRAGRSIRYLVPEPVRAYILEHGLYREQP